MIASAAAWPPSASSAVDGALHAGEQVVTVVEQADQAGGADLDVDGADSQ